MSSNFTVIYDACVLYPAPLRDLLMRLALTDLYRARWTDMIHDEWTRNVLKQRPDLKPEDLGVDVKPRIKTLKVSEPPKRGAGVKVADVAALVDKLKNEAKVI